MSYQYINDEQVAALEGYAPKQKFPAYIDSAIGDCIEQYIRYDKDKRPQPGEVNAELDALRNVLISLSADAREHLKELGERVVNMQGMVRTEPYMRLLEYSGNDVARLIEYCGVEYRRTETTPGEDDYKEVRRGDITYRIANPKNDTTMRESRKALLFHIVYMMEYYRITAAQKAMPVIVDTILDGISNEVGVDIRQVQGLKSAAGLIKAALPNGMLETSAPVKQSKAVGPHDWLYKKP